MKKNKGIFVLIAVIFIVSLFGCSKTDSSQNSNASNDAIKIGLITDLGGINDHSFNQASYEGLKQLKEAYPNVTISYLESKSFSDYSLNIDTYVDEDTDLIITVGATFIETLEDAAKNYPNQKFAITGVPIRKNLKNVASIVFANEESGFIAGAAAALNTKTSTIGYIQGMANDSLNLFGIGYVQGAKAINKDIKILMYNANNFADIAGGNVAATNMIINGADVIYQVAGATGIGVINACADNNKFTIGSDIDQSPIAPNAVLMSTIQHVDTAVKEYCESIITDGFKSGIIKGDISNEKLDFAYNDTILKSNYKGTLVSLANDIKEKEIKISTNKKDCPEFTLDN